jgi:hypothetical protein
LPPDATGQNKVVAWTLAGKPEYVFLANTDWQHPVVRFGLPLLSDGTPPPMLKADFSTDRSPVPEADQELVSNGKHYRISTLRSGEGRVYRVSGGTGGAHVLPPVE